MDEPHAYECVCPSCAPAAPAEEGPTPVLSIRLPGGSLAMALEGDEASTMMARLVELLPPVVEARVVLVDGCPADALRNLKE